MAVSDGKGKESKNKISDFYVFVKQPPEWRIRIIFTGKD